MRALLALPFLFGIVHASLETPPPAKTVIANAKAKAAKEGKSVMVIFHASWCGWCKRMDAWMATPGAKPFFDKHFVVCHLTVLENGDMKKHENAGGMDMMKTWYGEEAGLPFTVILDKTGKMVTNSNSEKNGTAGNIGCPWKKEEQDWFFKMISTARPKATKDELAKLRASLVEYVNKNGG